VRRAGPRLRQPRPAPRNPTRTDPVVHIHVGFVSDDGHRLRARGAHGDELAVELVRELRRRLCGPCAADDDAGPLGSVSLRLGRPVRGQRHPERGKSDGTRDESPFGDECYVNRPVTSIRFSELARPVEWIDDPHPRRVQPFRAARRLFGEDSIVGVSLREHLDDQLMRSPIARGAERVGVGARAVGDRP